jgi:hypothetical protein
LSICRFYLPSSPRTTTRFFTHQYFTSSGWKSSSASSRRRPPEHSARVRLFINKLFLRPPCWVLLLYIVLRVLLNFYLYSLRVPVILVCCFLLNTPAKLLASFVNLSDLPSRYESGDFFVNSFYLWWTSLYYLPSIFIVFTLCFIFYKNVVTFPLVILPVLLAVCSCGADITDH